jgi:hypothetical protein
VEGVVLEPEQVASIEHKPCFFVSRFTTALTFSIQRLDDSPRDRVENLGDRGLRAQPPAASRTAAT